MSEAMNAWIIGVGSVVEGIVIGIALVLATRSRSDAEQERRVSEAASNSQIQTLRQEVHAMSLQFAGQMAAIGRRVEFIAGKVSHQEES